MQNEQEEAEVVLIASKLTCRLCLQKHTDINSMLSSFSDEKSLADIYEICFNFKVNTSLITTSICSWCEDNLVRVFNFK